VNDRLAAELLKRAQAERERVARSMRPSWEPPHWLVALAKWGSVPALAILTALALWLNASAKEAEERAKAIAAEREAAAEDRRRNREKLDDMLARLTACEALAPKVDRHHRALKQLEAWRATQTKANPHRAPLPLIVEDE
jgi:hypothetical protein